MCSLDYRFGAMMALTVMCVLLPGCGTRSTTSSPAASVNEGAVRRNAPLNGVYDPAEATASRHGVSPNIERRRIPTLRNGRGPRPLLPASLAGTVADGNDPGLANVDALEHPEA
jgi:hypothetical protein